MAQQKLSHTRSIVRRLRAYRRPPSNIIPFPARQSDAEALKDFMQSLDWRSYVDLRFLQLAHVLGFEVAGGPDDVPEVGPDEAA